MEEIHQLVHTLTFGDAISGEVFALQDVLRAAGSNSEIFALNIDPRYKSAARDISHFPTEFKGTVILHYSLGSPLNQRYTDLNCAHRILVYHNLTPAKWFAGINPRITRDIEQGLKELPELCKISDLLISDSKYNASELGALGFHSEVLPLPVDPKRWGLEPNSGILNLLKADSRKHLLHVGRVAPNKCIEDLIKITYFLHKYLELPCKLWLVGHDIDTELYSFSLKRLVRELDLMEVVEFTGRMADQEIKALYLSASIYLCMSEHEGFCCPVVEAMEFGLPVVAYASSALPDTVGGAGVLVHNKEHIQVAELVKRVCLDSSLRSELIAAGKQRVAELSYENFAKLARELLLKPAASKAAMGQ